MSQQLVHELNSTSSISSVIFAQTSDFIATQDPRRLVSEDTNIIGASCEATKFCLIGDSPPRFQNTAKQIANNITHLLVTSPALSVFGMVCLFKKDTEWREPNASRFFAHML